MRRQVAVDWAAAETATGFKKAETRCVVRAQHSPRGWKNKLARKENNPRPERSVTYFPLARAGVMVSIKKIAS